MGRRSGSSREGARDEQVQRSRSGRDAGARQRRGESSKRLPSSPPNCRSSGGAKTGGSFVDTRDVYTRYGHYPPTREEDEREERRPVRLKETRSACEDDKKSQERSRSAPRALFLMGLPGAGKSTVKKRRMHRGDVDIEPDAFKCRHRRFSLDMDEETDDEVHRWSVRRAADTFEDALVSDEKPNLIFDSSGSNARWLLRRIDSARSAGYRTELLWVDVPLEIALLRNRDRAYESKGARWCPESVIVQKDKVLVNSFEELRKEVDSAERLQNWSEGSKERSIALEDIYVYPYPRTCPPPLRPGDEEYGEAPAGARSPSPTRDSMRKIRIGPWRRSDEVMERKTARLAWMDRTYRGNRERYVMEKLLKRRETYLEPNLFPYQLPPDLEHWTIWSRRDMEHDELCKYVEGWLEERKPNNVVSWNYDDNRGKRTISVWHVHIYFQGANGEAPSIGQRSRQCNSPRKSLHRSPCSV